MKKILLLAIITMFCISGLQAGAFSQSLQSSSSYQETIYFSSPTIEQENGYTTFELPEATSFSVTPGEYILPVVTQTYHIPIGSTIDHIEVSYSDITEQHLSEQPSIASQPIPDIYTTLANPSSVQENIDTPTPLAPSESFTYTLGAGRYQDEFVCYVTIQLYPLSYNAQTETLSVAHQADIDVSYTLPEHPVTLADEYELLIISPAQFSQALQPLVDHKQSHDMTTILVTRDEICNGDYFPAEGRDCAEEMKYFIKNVFDEWGIKYVLLVGGRQGGILEEKWWVPVRYSHLDDGGEASYLTDWYFADIYDDEMNFSSWDSNDNGVFAEWQGTNKDILDMYHEVYVGRIPCRNTIEVKTVINKIIRYENEAYGQEWVKKFVGVAGDTYPSVGDPYYEGELATAGSYAYLEPLGYESSFVWTSNGRFTGKDAVIDEVSLGCGFLHFSGHGNPHVWSNHPPEAEDEWVDGPNSFDMIKMRNAEKLPVTIVGGCHNAQYNVSLLNIIKGILENGMQYFSTETPFGDFWYKEWVPRCWAWSLANKRGGGSIATIANTGLGYGASGEGWNQSRGRVMEMYFFKSYTDGYEHLGETHGMDVVYYMTDFPPMDDQTDCKIAQQWALLGDPSLLIGGYEP